MLNMVYDQLKNSDSKAKDDMHKKQPLKLMRSNFAKHMPTFVRLQKKLQKIEKICPELYHSDKNVIEIFANYETTYRLDPTVTIDDAGDANFVQRRITF